MGSDGVDQDDLSSLCHDIATLNLEGHGDVVRQLNRTDFGGIPGLQKDVLASLFEDVISGGFEGDESDTPSLFHVRMGNSGDDHHDNLSYTWFGIKTNYNSALWAYKWRTHNSKGCDGVAVGYISKDFSLQKGVMGAILLHSVRGPPRVFAIKVHAHGATFSGNQSTLERSNIVQRLNHHQHSRFHMWGRVGNLTFCGNPGVGKSTIVNLLCGRPTFTSGESMNGVTQANQSVVMEFGGELVDTPGIVDVAIEAAAKMLMHDAILMSERQIFSFVMTVESGRVRPADVKVIRAVLAATGVAPERLHNKFVILINKCTPRAISEATEMVSKLGQAIEPYSTSRILLIPKTSDTVHLSAALALLWGVLMDTTDALVFRHAVQNVELSLTGIAANLARGTEQRKIIQTAARARQKRRLIDIRRAGTLIGYVDPEYRVETATGLRECDMCGLCPFGFGLQCVTCGTDVCLGCLIPGSLACSEPCHTTCLVFTSAGEFTRCSTPFCANCFKPMFSSELDREPIHHNHENGCCVCSDCAMLNAECPRCHQAL